MISFQAVGQLSLQLLFKHISLSTRPPVFPIAKIHQLYLVSVTYIESDILEHLLQIKQVYDKNSETVKVYSAAIKSNFLNIRYVLPREPVSLARNCYLNLSNEQLQTTPSCLYMYLHVLLCHCIFYIFITHGSQREKYVAAVFLPPYKSTLITYIQDTLMYTMNN